MEDNERCAMQLTTAIILVGGRSRRMNYQDKMNLRVGDESFLEHILKKMSLFKQVVISLNNDQVESIQKTKAMIIVDKWKDIGPLGGIYSVMEAIPSEYYFVLSCDMPLIQQELIVELYRSLEYGYQAVVAIAEERVHPLFAIYHRSIMEIVGSQIESEDYKMMNLLDKVETKYVNIDAKGGLCNINTPEDYYKMSKESVR